MLAHDRACSLDACMLAHAAAFACAKPVYFTCALKAHHRACSPDWNLKVAGTAMSASEGWKAGLRGDALQIKNIGYKLENL